MSYRFRGRVALGIAALSAAVVWAADGRAPAITPQELGERLAQGRAPLVVDVRTPQEYAAGHIPGAVNVPYDQVAQRSAELVGKGELAIYCQKGSRARVAEEALRKAGAAAGDVRDVEGSFAAWEAAGLPVVKGPAPN